MQVFLKTSYFLRRRFAAGDPREQGPPRPFTARSLIVIHCLSGLATHLPQASSSKKARAPKEVEAWWLFLRACVKNAGKP